MTDRAVLLDDLGRAVPARVANRPVNRVVSLVPSLTEAIAATDVSLLVGATDWCTHPPDLAVRRVRGTKNPDLARIRELAPDVVLANREENRRVDVDRLAEAGIGVWVTEIETLEQGLRSLRRIVVELLQRPVPEWLRLAAEAWAAPPQLGPLRVAVAVWRDPWMVVGARTFVGDLLARLGLHNVFAGSDQRYPHVTIDEIRAARPDVVLLPDEPYPFTAGDGPEALTGLPCALLPGRALSWYGPSLVSAADAVRAALVG